MHMARTRGTVQKMASLFLNRKWQLRKEKGCGIYIMIMFF